VRVFSYSAADLQVCALASGSGALRSREARADVVEHSEINERGAACLPEEAGMFACKLVERAAT
jgi:hypothetical protein